MEDELIAGAFTVIAVLLGAVVGGGSVRARLSRRIRTDIELLEKLSEDSPFHAALSSRIDAQLYRYVNPWSRLDGFRAGFAEVVLLIVVGGLIVWFQNSIELDGDATFGRSAIATLLLSMFMGLTLAFSWTLWRGAYLSLRDPAARVLARLERWFTT